MSLQPAAAPGTIFDREIREQPAVLAALLDDQTGVAEAAAACERERPSAVRFIARGTSANAAVVGQRLFERRLGVAPMSMTLDSSAGSIAQPDPSVLHIAVSQSGESPDLLEAMATARTAGALTIAVTNTVSSPLAAVCDHVVDIGAGTESAVTASKSYTAQLLSLHLLVDRIAGGDGRRLAEIPVAVDAVLDADPAAIESLASTVAAARSVVVVGRSYSVATAREAALKLIEACYLPALAFDTADALHGPVALGDSTVAALVVSSDEMPDPSTTEVTQKFIGAGADVAVVGRNVGVPLVVGLPVVPTADQAPIVEIVPLQQMVLAVARILGTDPDAPRNIQKVTRTQ